MSDAMIKEVCHCKSAGHNSFFPSGSQKLEAKKKKDEEKRQVEEQAREEKVSYSMCCCSLCKK